MEIVILYRDDRVLAVHKPAGVHVHPSPFSRGELSLIEILEAQLGVKPFTVHRLDRPTSGVLVFALDHEMAAWLGGAFRERRIDKTYWAVVRGWMPETHSTFDVKLDRHLSQTTDAETWFRPLENYEAPWPRHEFSTFRFGLVEAKPVTGRRHQIRQHCDDLRHPIVGDTVWGDTGMNHWFSSQLEAASLVLGGLHLWCRRLELPLPEGGFKVLEAPLWPQELQRLTFYRGFQTLQAGP